MSKALLAIALLAAVVTVAIAAMPGQPTQRWSEVAEVVAPDRFFPDTFGPSVPVVRLRLDSGRLVTAPMPTHTAIQPGKVVELTATRTRFGRIAYRLNDRAIPPPLRAG